MQATLKRIKSENGGGGKSEEAICGAVNKV
jgi:hypothetical protein